MSFDLIQGLELFQYVSAGFIFSSPLKQPESLSVFSQKKSGGQIECIYQINQLVVKSNGEDVLKCQ